MRLTLEEPRPLQKGGIQPVKGRWTGVAVKSILSPSPPPPPPPVLNGRGGEGGGGGYTFRNLRTTNLLDESTTHTRWSSATVITLSARWTQLENIFDHEGMGF